MIKIPLPHGETPALPMACILRLFGVDTGIIALMKRLMQACNVIYDSRLQGFNYCFCKGVDCVWDKRRHLTSVCKLQHIAAFALRYIHI